MNDSTSTDALTTSASALQATEHDPTLQNGAHLSNGTDPVQTNSDLTNGVSEQDAESEAETLITSPVKKAEAAKQNAAAAAHQRHTRVMAKDGDNQNGTADAPGSSDSPDTRTRIKSEANKAGTDNDSDHGSSSEVLSDVDDNDDHSSVSSQHSRSVSEQADAQTTNSRKRKHRASSVSFPNKRQSVDVSRRRKRGVTEDRYDGDTNDRSDSPQSRNHRRAVSTQSLQDGVEPQGSRKRRSIATSRETTKSTRPGWDEESMSSETTSLGQVDQKRPQRGVGRSTSTPGRPVGRETKRHVNKYGYTRLAEACETDDLELVKEWREKDPDQLEIAEFAGNKPLQIAAINGNADVVRYLIAQGCQIDCENDVRDTPLIDAAENGHSEVVQILLDAGVDPLRQNRKGQQALDVINDDTDNVADIRASLRAAIERWSSDDAKQRREEEEEKHRYRAGPSKELHFMARSYENLMRLVTLNDRNSVREFLDARVPVDNAIIAAAAKTGDLYLVNMLLAEMPEKKRYQKAEKPMLSVLGTSHFDMVKNLTELDQFNPRWTNRQDKTWSEIAEEKAGPMWRQEVELLRRLEKEAASSPKARQSSSPILRRNEASGKARNSTGSKDNDESDANGSDADTPRQRKNGRRLMSRKDMRAASGKKQSPGSDDSESDEGESGEAIRRMPSPKEKRGPGRPRTKPAIIKTEESEEKDRKEAGRRRSVSHRAAAKPSLPIVAEGKEAQTTDHDGTTTTSEANTVPPDAQNPPSTTSSSKEQQNEPTQATASTSAETATDKENVEMQDSVDAASQQEELNRQHEAEQEQVQREMEQQLKAEADARVKELEEIEKEREREREREEQRRKEELEQAKEDARRQILSSLPPQSIALQLDPDSDFSYQELGAVDTILRYVEPLQVVYMTDLSAKHDAVSSEPMVLNLLVAPLLGKEKGLDSLLQDEHVLAADWTSTISVLEEERRILLPLLRKSAFAQHDGYDDEIMINGTQDSFTTELNRAARMHKSALQIYQKLLTGPFTMRWLPLQHVVEHLHPIFHGRDIAISEDWRAVFRNALRRDGKSQDDAGAAPDFFERVAHYWQQPLAPKSCRHGQILATTTRAPAVDGWANVGVTGQK